MSAKPKDATAAERQARRRAKLSARGIVAVTVRVPRDKVESIKNRARQFLAAFLHPTRPN